MIGENYIKRKTLNIKNNINIITNKTQELN